MRPAREKVLLLWPRRLYRIDTECALLHFVRWGWLEKAERVDGLFQTYHLAPEHAPPKLRRRHE